MAGLDPIRLEAKEGLALINGTQYSLALLIHALDNAVSIAEAAELCAAMSMDAF
jgi:histidine ammonia-lyase